MIVLDASVILKWVLPDETDSPAALAYLNQHIEGTNPIAVPELLFYEIANALATKTSLLSADIIERFTLIVGAELESYHLNIDTFSEAIQMSKRFKISLYDSSYIALAQLLGCDMITADSRLRSSVKVLQNVKSL